MAITVRGKNIEITPALKDYVEKRIDRVAKYFEQPGEVTAFLTVEKGRHIVEVTVSVGGILLRGEESTQDMYTSIDLVIDKLERQIGKYKTKLAKRMRNGGGFRAEVAAAAAASSAALTELEDEAQVVKTKRFAIKPMAVEEAIMQMNLIHHDFYVFSNAETEEVNVVYRRKDGRYGLIEPEF